MANLKATKKQIRKTIRENNHNKVIKSATRTKVKKFLSAIEEQDLDKAKAELINAVSALDKMGKTNLLHKNNVARKKSQLQKKLNGLVVAKTIPQAPKAEEPKAPEAKA